MKCVRVYISSSIRHDHPGQGRKMISRSRQKSVTPVSFDAEPVILTQSDVNASNFGVDKAGKTVLFNFSSIGWLPLSFAKYAMPSTNQFTADVVKFWRWSGPSSNGASMAAISSCLWMTSELSLGASTCT